MEGGRTPHQAMKTLYRLRCTVIFEEGSRWEVPPTRLSDSSLNDTNFYDSGDHRERRGCQGHRDPWVPVVSSAHQLWVQQPKDIGISGGLSGSLRAEDLLEMGLILRLCWAQSSLC